MRFGILGCVLCCARGTESGVRKASILRREAKASKTCAFRRAPAGSVWGGSVLGNLRRCCVCRSASQTRCKRLGLRASGHRERLGSWIFLLFGEPACTLFGGGCCTRFRIGLCVRSFRACGRGGRRFGGTHRLAGTGIGRNMGLASVQIVMRGIVMRGIVMRGIVMRGGEIGSGFAVFDIFDRTMMIMRLVRREPVSVLCIAGLFERTRIVSFVRVPKARIPTRIPAGIKFVSLMVWFWSVRSGGEGRGELGYLWSRLAFGRAANQKHAHSSALARSARTGNEKKPFAVKRLQGWRGRSQAWFG